METSPFDALVVGSGASAVHAAWPLAQAGFRVAMLDVGNQENHYARLIPPRGFTEIRRTDPEQHRYFLGDQFEGISLSRIAVGAQLTPPRTYITRDAGRLSPILSDNFTAMQSFAVGGLAAGWGASTIPFSDTDLSVWPISRQELQPHYEAITRRIGMCGAEDDISQLIGTMPGMMPPADLDSNAEFIYQTYLRRRKSLQKSGFYMGRAWLALATREFRGRGPLRYEDMEYWSDQDRSVYRPHFTVEELRSFQGFSYLGGLFVESFEQDLEERVRVNCLNLRTGLHESVVGRRLILAAGALGTTRLVLKSLNRYDEAVPLLTNAYTYFPSLNLRRLGKPTRDRRHGLTQLTMFLVPGGEREHTLQLQLYSYRSLLLFKLVRELFLGRADSIRLLQMLQDYFVIFGVFQEDHSAPGKSLRLRHGASSENDILEANYHISAEVARYHRIQERRVLKLLMRLDCLPVGSIRPGYGSSIHYAGSFPMCEEGHELTTKPTGQLRAAPHVYLADGSTFPHLPAKSLTFTLMANANRVGTIVCEELQKGGEG